MDIAEKLVNPLYWETVIGATAGILIMAGLPALCIVTAYNYGKRAWYLPILGILYFAFAVSAPLPAIEAANSGARFEVDAMLRAVSSCLILFSVLYFEAYYKDGKAKVAQTTLDIFVSPRKAHALKWRALGVFGYLLMSLGVILGAYATILFYGESMAWVVWAVTFAGTFNSGLFFTLRSQRREIEHDLKHGTLGVRNQA